MTQTTKQRYYVPALEKGLDILEYLSDLSVPQSQADIARALGRKTSEVFRMLDCLEQRRYLRRDEAGRYQLSLKLFELAHTHSPVEQLLEAARAPMHTLAERLRESVHLSILHDHKLLVLAEALSPNPVRISVEVGRSFPALKTASGRLLLANLDEEGLEAFLAQNPHFVNAAKKEQKQIRAFLKEQHGTSNLTAESDITVGVQDVAQLVGQPSLGVSATLTVPLLMLKGKDTAVEATQRALTDTANLINERLGLR